MHRNRYNRTDLFALVRWADTIGPESIERRNDRVVQLARSLKAAYGRLITTAKRTGARPTGRLMCSCSAWRTVSFRQGCLGCDLQSMCGHAATG
jgi:hypothetical protein